MTDYLVLLNRWALVAFVLCTMAGVGLLLQVDQILQVLRERRQLGLTLLANFVVLPTLAWWVCRSLNLDVSIQAALLLATTAPGSPTLLRLNAIARADQALAVGQFVLLAVLTVVHVARDGLCRVISFRRASREEREAYLVWIENECDEP